MGADPGLNAIIGPGDTAKSTILDALDLVLGTRRGSFTEVDFHRLNLDDPIIIDVSVGDLSPEILDLEAYSSAIRGWNDFLGDLNDEPGDGDEPVITIRLAVRQTMNRPGAYIRSDWQIRVFRVIFGVRTAR